MAQNSVNSPEIDRVGFRPAQFCKEKPSIGFYQMEAQFETCNITADLTKYNYTVQALDSSVPMEVSEILAPAFYQSPENIRHRSREFSRNFKIARTSGSETFSIKQCLPINAHLVYCTRSGRG